MYRYEEQKPSIFTEEGQVMFLKIRDNIERLLRNSGAVRMQEAISGCTGSTWEMIACVDRLVEIGEIVELTSEDALGQYRVFIQS
jgi:hypothetical protein